MAEPERVKPRALYEEEAIEHARESRWAEAVATNRALLERYGPSEGAQNRLGKALLEQGKFQEALESYQRALELNPLNMIAQKNTAKIAAMLEAPLRVGVGAGVAVDASLFTEEPGKSALTMLTPPSGGVSVTVVPGDSVDLEVDGGSVHARTARGVALGDIDAKIARRLLPLIATGNRYTAAVARVQHDRIELMLREVHQSSENTRKTSFPIARAKKDDFKSYARESLLANREIDDSAFDSGDNENLPGSEDESDGGMTGMHDAAENDAAPVAGDDDDDDDDDDDGNEDKRPEDEY